MSYNTDINNMNLENEVVSYDPDAEVNPNLTVPDGTYLMELTLGRPRQNQDHPVIVTQSKAGKSYVEAQINGKIIAPGTSWDGRLVFGQASSLVFESSNTSMLHQLLKAIGQPAPASCTLGQFKTQVENALGGGAQAYVRTRWEASVKNSDGSDPKYLTVRGMKKFPQRGNGTFDTSYTFTLGDGSEISKDARPTFVDFQPATNGSAAHSG